MSAETAIATPPSMEGQGYLDELIHDHAERPGLLLTLLEAVQERQPNHYLRAEVLEYIAARTRIPSSQIYSVATFYGLFNLRPQGEHAICVCRGTACHTHGSRALLKSAMRKVG